MELFDKIIKCFPPDIVQLFRQLDDSLISTIEEIRVYRGKNIQIISKERQIQLPCTVNGRSINTIVNNLMKYSYYSYEEEISKGFITIDGGHRVGICGKTVLENGKVKIIRQISSINIRYSKEFIDCAKEIYNVISKGGIKNTLIVSPPGFGKTTILRDLARQISMTNIKVGICDERSEIAGMVNGESSYTFGKMVDVLDGCPKAEGMIMMIRSMSPQIIITDEIGKSEDVDAIKSCINCGVKIIASIHGESMDDIKRSEISKLFQNKLFNYIIFLTNKPLPGTIREVYYA